MPLPQSSTYANLGGELGEYQAVVDPTTDLPGDADNQMRSDAAGMTRTAVRAMVTFTIAATVATVIEHDSNWGNDPAVAPVVTYGGSTGLYNIAWPATVTDPRGVSRALNLRRGWVNVAQGTAHGALLPTAPNTAQVQLSVGAALANPTGAVTAWVL